ncbi:MAG: MATE family efflux transporter [Porphyromonas sp.]|nr:MATE family efflux transporter [Porphyromonas sp.]
MATARYSTGTAHKWILRLAIPNILSNITVPLLGIFDLGMSGRLQHVHEIGAVALAATLFNMLYWTFGFLRMGTTGLTAQACGKGDKVEMGRILQQSFLIGSVIGFLLLFFGKDLVDFLLQFVAFGTSKNEELITTTTSYFLIVIWGAPAVLSNFALNGWIIGMQNSWYPMTIAIITNVTNILLSALFTFQMNMGIAGIALGTSISHWLSLILLLFGVWWLFIRKKRVSFSWRMDNLTFGIRKFFHTNIFIFFRTLLLVITNTYFTYYGATQGEIALSANAILLQFLSFFSYFIDGFAYSAEAIIGHLFGAERKEEIERFIYRLLGYGLLLSLIASGIYFLFGEDILRLFTDKTEVLNYANHYLIWIWLIPIAGFAAFVWDGVFIGLTLTKYMFISMLIAVSIYFVVIYIDPSTDPNSTLWIAMLLYLSMRGVMLHTVYNRRKQSLIFNG